MELPSYASTGKNTMLGKPTRVQAISSPTATGVDRQTAILLGFANGEQAVLHAALDTPGPNTAFVLAFLVLFPEVSLRDQCLGAIQACQTPNYCIKLQ
jgi:hypothetical protein